jgi:hypothetical protein
MCPNNPTASTPHNPFTACTEMDPAGIVDLQLQIEQFHRERYQRPRDEPSSSRSSSPGSRIAA